MFLPPRRRQRIERRPDSPISIQGFRQSRRQVDFTWFGIELDDQVDSVARFDAQLSADALVEAEQVLSTHPADSSSDGRSTNGEPDRWCLRSAE
jgi:hypothetical protein